jgi:4-hydroxy-tetrahydrodipicolinate synthase
MRTPGGIWAGPITPMNGDFSLDLAGLRWLTDYVVSSGVHGLIPGAFTAEIESLDLSEHKRILEIVVETAAGRVPVYCGVSRPSILETRAVIDFARDLGADGIFVVPPFCNSYTLDEIVRFLEDVARRTTQPIMLYNSPNYCGVNLSPTVQGSLARIDNIASSKEGNQGQLHQTVLEADADMAVFSARDSYLVPSLAVGADGVTSFVANVAPELIMDLYRAACDGDEETVRMLHPRVSRLVDALVARSYPLMLKTAMSLLDLPSGPARRIEGGATDEEIVSLRDALRFALPVRAI